jgi:hypothetical protein
MIDETEHEGAEQRYTFLSPTSSVTRIRRASLCTAYYSFDDLDWTRICP